MDLILSQQEYVTEMDRAKLEHALGLDVPIHIQYLRWMGQVLRGNLGTSLWAGYDAAEEIIRRLPITVELGTLAIVLSLLIAIPVGVYSAMRQDTAGDYAARSFAIILLAVPSFWSATLIMIYPSIWWNWSPDTQYIPFVENPARNLIQFIIPAAILGMHLSGTTMRITRTMMLEVLRQDYIRAAWAKGLAEKTVIVKHALKNALIPVVTQIGLLMPVVIGGSVIIEQIFCLPGIGRLLLDTLTVRDYTVVSAVNLFIASFIMLTVLTVDLSYTFLDPRIRY